MILKSKKIIILMLILQIKVLSSSKVPERVITMAPGITEILFAIGVGDKIVGVSEYDVYPPQVKNLPKVGGYLDPNFEGIIRLEPDIILILGKNERLVKFCEKVNIRYKRFQMETIKEIFDSIIEISKMFKKEKEGIRLVNKIKSELEEIKRKASKYRKVRVFLSLGSSTGEVNHLYTIGSDNFINELIEIAGGENIFKDVKIRYPEVSREAVIERRPEIILLARPEIKVSDKVWRKEINQWKKFTFVPAVLNNRIYPMKFESILHSGPRIGEIAKYFYEIFFGKKDFRH